MITELRRLIYTYSEYFHAQWVNCTKKCKKIQKTIIFSTYLPNLEALWHDFACVWTIGHTGRPGCAICKHSFFFTKKNSFFGKLFLETVKLCTVFTPESPLCKGLPKKTNLVEFHDGCVQQPRTGLWANRKIDLTICDSFCYQNCNKF